MTRILSPTSVDEPRGEHSSDQEAEQGSSNVTCGVVTLMKQRLPEYIVNCFISSGYDEMEVISTMDTSDKEHNSIDKIEKFIQRKYANSAAHNPFSSPTFEFPPGHRIRICNFVKEVERVMWQ